jgi:hypothetical protein
MAKLRAYEEDTTLQDWLIELIRAELSKDKKPSINLHNPK